MFYYIMSHYVCYHLSLFGNFEERDMQEINVLFWDMLLTAHVRKFVVRLNKKACRLLKAFSCIRSDYLQLSRPMLNA